MEAYFGNSTLFKQKRFEPYSEWFIRNYVRISLHLFNVLSLHGKLTYCVISLPTFFLIEISIAIVTWKKRLVQRRLNASLTFIFDISLASYVK